MSLAQVQRNYQFKFPLEVAIYEGSGEARIERVEMDDLNKTFEIDFATKPERIELDPNTNLLATWDFKGK